MVWTAPSSKTTASTLTKADWDTFVRDNLEALVERPTVGLRGATSEATGTTTISSGSPVAVEWGEEVWDSHGMHSTSVNPERITAPAGWAGIYLVCATVTFAAGDKDGYRRVRILSNGSTVWGVETDAPQGARDRTTLCCIAFVNLAVGDYITAEVAHDSGSDITLFAGNDDDELGCALQVMYLGGAGSSSAALTLGGVTGSVTDWWNTDVVNSFTRLRSRPMYRAQTTSAISANSGVWTTLLMGTENFDTDNLHSTSVETSRFTATRSGVYLLVGEATFESNATAQRRIRFRRDGAATQFQSAGQGVPGLATSMRCVMFTTFEAGEFADLQVNHGAGVTLDATGWLGAVWLGQTTRVAGAQRLVDGWDDAPYAGGGQTGVVPRAWLNIHTRDLPGILQAPPIIQTRARFARDITPGEWKKVKWNRQSLDTWNTVKGKRNFGEKYVVPVDGTYLTGTQLTIKDDQIIQAKFEVVAKTISSVDTANDYLTMTAHGFRTGALIRVSSETTMPGGLVAGRDYFVRYIDDDRVSLHPTRGDAQGNTNRVNITSAGTGTRRAVRSFLESPGLNLRTGTIVQVFTTGTLPAGLSASTNYYVVRSGPKRFRLAPDEEAADDNVFTTISDTGSGTHRIRVQEPFGARGARIVHSGEVQAGFAGQPTSLWQTCRPVVAIVAAKAEDELWVEALTKGPDGSRITATAPASRWFAVWTAPFDYTGALPIQDRD